MSLLVLGSGSSGYQIQRSVRLRSSASAYFNRTPGSSPTSTTKYTLSVWYKKAKNGVVEPIISARAAASPYEIIEFQANDTLILFSSNGSTLVTNQVFRDPSSWYHIVVSVDTTQATAANRILFYINGQQVTSFSTATYPAQNTAVVMNSTVAHWLAEHNGSGISNYIDGYITEFNMIDGQALTPSSFGQTNSITGVWQPKAYAGTYGTNGFYLKFTDNSAATATAIGKDYSGNGNNWTPNNISVTAGTTYDSMLDVPTLNSPTAANFPVMSPITGTTNLSNGNLYLTGAGAYRSGYSTIAFPSTGKWYWEGVFTQANNNLGFGAASIGPNTPPNPLPNTGGIGITNGGFWYLDTSTGTSGHTGWAAATVVGMTWDSSTNTFAYTVDGTNYNTVGSVSTTDGRIWAPAAWAFAANDQLTLNFGQRPFSYTPRSGYIALNTFNLPTPSIPNGAVQFASTLYTGTGATQTIANTSNGYNFQPDFVWIKGRSGATNHALYDSVRGVTKQLIITTAAETTEATGLTAFGSTGFTIGALAALNTNAATYVAWNWKASNASAVTNTAGTITSQVSANPTAGFSILTWTGIGGNIGQTIGHGLGVAPKMIIVKDRVAGVTGTDNWPVYHASTGASNFLLLNGTAASTTSTIYWNNTAPTSSVFSVAGNSANVSNESGKTYVGYCFAEIAGFSKFGSYTANASTDGPFVYTGFRPKLVCIKRSDLTGGWTMLDTSRDPYNVASQYLFAEAPNAEGSTSLEDFLSNGFKIRSTSTSINGSGGTYIYFAFAENPFQYALAR